MERLGSQFSAWAISSGGAASEGWSPIGCCDGPIPEKAQLHHCGFSLLLILQVLHIRSRVLVVCNVSLSYKNTRCGTRCGFKIPENSKNAEMKLRNLRKLRIQPKVKGAMGTHSSDLTFDGRCNINSGILHPGLTASNYWTPQFS